MKNVLRKLLFPHPALLALLIPCSAALLIWAFLGENVHPALVYGSYGLSAYGLTVLCARAPAIWRWGKGLQAKKKKKDQAVQMARSLYMGLAINLLYAGMQLALGMTERSAWFYSLAGYYAVLALMRFFLAREARRKRLGQDRYFEYLLYRLCGVLLVGLHGALGVMVFFMVRQDRGTAHHPIVTIAMAAYTFYSLTMAVIHAFRRNKAPLAQAADTVTLAAALVSLLSLERAMLATFDGSGGSFRRIITGISGTAVCAAILAAAIYMLVHGTKEIKRYKDER